MRLTESSSSRTQWHRHNKFPAQNGTRFHRTNQPETCHTRYDDQGNRIEETTVTGTNAPVTTYYLVDGNNPTGYAQVIEQSATPGTPTITYIWGGSLISQDNAAGSTNAGTYYLITDAQRSTQLLVNAAGGVVQDYQYDAFGNAVGFTVSSAITDYLYNQQYYDVISGQYYFRARNYDSATGTFTQQDSYTINPGDLANANLYLYAGANPINMFDPSGHDLMETLGSIAIGMVLNAGISQVAAPFASAIDAMLVPSWLVDDFLTAGLPDAVELGLGGTKTWGIPSLPGISAGFAGGLELLASPWGRDAALYAYFGGAFGFLGQAGAGSAGGSLGLVWNSPASGDYAGPFVTLSLPYQDVPRNLKAKIGNWLSDELTSFTLTPAVLGTLALGAPEGEFGLADAIALQFHDMQRAMASASTILNSFSVNLFASPVGTHAFGFSIGLGAGSGAGSGFAIDVTNYWQLLPSGTSVNFQ